MAKNLKKGVSFRFSDETLALLEELGERYGSKTDAMEAGLHALKHGATKRLTKAQLLAEIERRLK